MRRTAVIAAVAASISATVCSAQIRAGDEAPPITLEAISNAPEGKAMPSWEDYGDNLVVLEFWGTWCYPCVAAIPHLNELADHVAERGDVRFLSVTYERPEQIEAFLEVNEMESVIGHDTDHSMVRALGVTAWPTTFLVRRGRVLARTHPTRLTAELLEGVADAATFEQASEVLGAINEAIERALDAAEDDADHEDSDLTDLIRLANAKVSVYVAPGDDQLRSVNTAMKEGVLYHIRLTGHSTRDVVEQLWRLEPWQIEADEWTEDSLWTVTMKAPPEMQDDARRMIASAMGVRVTERTDRVPGYAVSLAANGGVLRRGDDLGSSTSTYRDRQQGITVRAENTDLRSLLALFKDALAKPADVPDELAVMRFTGTLTVPWDPAAAAKTLEESLRIRLEPSELERRVIRIDRLDDAG